MAATKKPTKAATAPRKRTAAPRGTQRADGPAGVRGWTFLTNHAHVLLCLAHGGSLTARELGMRIGITERSVQAILADLIEDGYLKKSKVGRRNSYTVNPKGRLRHPLEAAHTVGELIDALT
ncbi:helix-turn-helix transcriptional regulator [Mycobacterium sp. IDR2000157661]|uniref:helix-turn-helix transcriptional regulator n=1 Tax=Mycobacterium sp. IDR2000157661 TaxID=2867005 RepID=UPI001EE9CC52|nr:MarR family winged helix-turn-helix transcriptional regulator [Mycobacterium sp. IDR2000157661]ULE31521.1 MarR family winged helix-turn-helix transcriptional regulator [Mycobacterium sp. IDR2000157661]